MLRVLIGVLVLSSSLIAADNDPISDPTCILIRGYVRKPTSLHATHDLTLMKALQQAGGFADFADHHVLIWRSNEQRFINANERAIRSKQEVDPPLQKGDVVMIGAERMH